VAVADAVEVGVDGFENEADANDVLFDGSPYRSIRYCMMGRLVGVVSSALV
jgi:hypothetical protein